jgi:hypothetical protein
MSSPLPALKILSRFPLPLNFYFDYDRTYVKKRVSTNGRYTGGREGHHNLYRFSISYLKPLSFNFSRVESKAKLSEGVFFQFITADETSFFNAFTGCI